MRARTAAAGVVAGVLAGAVAAWLWPAKAAVPELAAEAPVTAQDLRVEPANNSPSVAIDPSDHRFVALANRLDNPDFGCALHLSGDGGRSWVPASFLQELPSGVSKCYAPDVFFDRAGVLYLMFTGLAGRGNQPVGVYLTTSTDRGATFSAPRRLLGARAYMARAALDDAGVLHLVWLQATEEPTLGGLPPSDNPILAARSTDGGKTFTEPVRVSDPARPLSVAPALVVDGANVHVAYLDLVDDVVDYRGLEGATWKEPWKLVVTTSTDGGRSFPSATEVSAELVPAERVMVIFTMPGPSLAALGDGRLAVAWDDARRGDRDVFLALSGDAGTSFTDARTLAGGPGEQYMARLSSSPGGRLDAVFYDGRTDGLLETALVSSYDGGRTFEEPLRLSSEPSDPSIGPTYEIPSAAGLIEFGSRLGAASLDDAVIAAWTDTRNSDGSRQQDVFAARVDLPRGVPPPLGIAAAGLLAAGLAGLLSALRLRT
jgi:hypothetical protein